MYYFLDQIRQSDMCYRVSICINDILQLTVCSYHVKYTFQSESTLYSCLNVKDLLARSRREIWSSSDCNWTRTHNHLVHKGTLSHLVKLAATILAKWLSVCLWTKWLWVRVQLQIFCKFPSKQPQIWFRLLSTKTSVIWWKPLSH